jgi:hypothetical protein
VTILATDQPGSWKLPTVGVIVAMLVSVRYNSGGAKII